MNILTKYYTSTLDAVSHRVLKVFGIGVKTADLVAPFGDDSCPLDNIGDAIYMETSNDDQPIIVGFINTGLLAGAGEKRLFSLKSDGSVSFYTWLKNDGTYEIGGNEKHMVRYEDLNAGLQAQVTKMQGQLTLIAAGIATAGGSYTPGDISLDISGSKIDEIKTL